MKRNLLIILLLCMASTAIGQTTYYWVGGTTAANISGTTSWNTKPDGTGSSRPSASIAATDVLVVDGSNIGGATPATGVVTIIVNATTTAQLKIINSAAVTLVRASSGVTFTIANNTTGEDGLIVDATSTLELATPTGGTYAGYVYLDLPASTARIAGKLKMSDGTAHRLTCRTVGGVVVTSTGSITYNTSSYPFGNTTTGTPGTSNSLSGAVVLMSGASLTAEGVYSPFGSSASSVIVDFRPGSNFYIRTTLTTGSITNAKTFGNLYIQNNAVVTMDGSTIYRIDNLTVDAGSVFNVGGTTSGNYIVGITGNLVVNGSFNGTPETSAYLGMVNLIMAGSTLQTISGTGAVTLNSLTIGSGSSVSLQKDITVNSGTCNIYGALLFNTYRLNGTATFVSRVGYTPTTASATVAAMAAGSYQVTAVPVGASSLSGLNGLSVTGTGIPANTNVVSFTSGGIVNLSQPVTVSGTNVSLTFGSDTATLQTGIAAGFGSGGSVNLSGQQTFSSGTNYIVNAVTTNPVGISSSNTAGYAIIGSLQLNADATTNMNLRVNGGLYLNQGRLNIRATDTLRLMDGGIHGNFGAAACIIGVADLSTGAKGVLRYDGITASTVIPLGTSTHYLPLTVNPAASGTGDYCVSVAEGITTDGNVNSASLTASELNRTVKATWYLYRLNGSGAANIAFSWPSDIQGTTFASAETCGIATLNNGVWPATLLGDGAVAARTVNADMASLSGQQVLSVWLKKRDQQISFPALSPVTYGDAAVTPAATGSNSGIAISYSSSNTAVASIVSGKINIVGAGTAVITASQDGNDLYNAATAVTQDFVVQKAPLTVTAENKTREKGAADPVFTAVYDGFVHGETAAVFTTPVSFTTDATVNSPAGIYNIIPANGVAANYAVTYVNGKLTITAPDLLNQTIAFPAMTAVSYGAADITPGATSSNSSIAVTYASNNTAVVTVVNGQLHIVGVGDAIITASQVGNDTYNPATDVTQTLTVNPAELTIKADNQSRNQGTANPVFTFTYTGFVNNETSAVLLTQPQATTTAVQSSPAGTYPITVGGATAANYHITFQDGVLTVNEFTQQVITFPAFANKTYGDADFATGASSNNASIAITYVSSNTSVATVSNGVIHIVGAGTADITASQAGNVNFGAATDVTRQLTVSKAVLVMKANDQSKYAGQVNPSLTMTTTGFVKSETSTVLTTQPVVTTTAVTVSPAGTYPITVSGAAAANYTFSYVAGTLTVKALEVQVITFPALAARTYGAADFNVGASSNNATIPLGYTSSNTAVATVTAGVVHITGTGSAVITVSQVGSDVYAAATSVSQTITVNKAAVTITADNKTKTAGQANPALTLSYAGLAYNETAAVLTTQPVVTTTATASSVAGSYPVTVSGAVAANYTFVYVPGTLTVYADGGSGEAALEVLGTKTNLQARIYVTVPVIGAVQLFDSYGRLLYTKKVYLPKGFTNVAVPAGTVKSGVYILTVTGDHLKLSKRIGLL